MEGFHEGVSMGRFAPPRKSNHVQIGTLHGTTTLILYYIILCILCGSIEGVSSRGLYGSLRSPPSGTKVTTYRKAHPKEKSDHPNTILYYILSGYFDLDS